MATQLRAVVSADVKRFVSGMSMVSASSVAAATAAIGAFAAVTTSIFEMNEQVIESSKEYETLALAMRFASKDATQARKEFERLVDFADRTPFDTKDLIKYSIQLRNVTSDAFGTAEQIENMAGALSKAQLLGKDKTFINSVGQIINAFQIGGGRLKLYIRTLQSTGAITTDTALKIKELSQSGGTAADAIELLEQEFKKSKDAADAFAKTTAGLESTLRSRFQKTIAELGQGGALDNYKKILEELNKIMVDIRDSAAFNELGRSLGLFNEEILKAIKSDEFKAFIQDLILVVGFFVKQLAVLIKMLNMLGKLDSIPTSVEGLIPKSVGMRGGGLLDRMQNKSTSDSIVYSQAITQEQLKELRLNREVNARTANTIDPQKQASVE